MATYDFTKLREVPLSQYHELIMTNDWSRDIYYELADKIVIRYFDDDSVCVAYITIYKDKRSAQARIHEKFCE